MPNKRSRVRYVDELTPAAKLVGAISTIVNDDGYLRGYNTKMYGPYFGQLKAVSIFEEKP